MKISVTVADASHARNISAIGMLSFFDAFSSLFNNEADLQSYLNYTYQVNKIRRSIEKENNIFLIAHANNQPAGFVKLKKFSLNPQLESVAQMELQKIYVLSDFHGTGVGSALMEAAMEKVNLVKPDLLWLDVHVANARAIRFYEKNGFRIVGKHEFIIGTQTFHYHLMSLPVLEKISKLSVA